ncbi:hypothetical protein AN644_04205 [Candidatus Epulonipiscium fishelsonii]|nr:hypothetical protein AN644_04205 [Epulopiscium sp. SCG-C06WGA-EpuloA1]
MNKYLIIADDFTGANDTGVQLKRRGIQTQVVLNEIYIKDDQYSYVLDTETRSHTEENAYNMVKTACQQINLNEYKYVIKKIDSTLRGNVAEEIKAVDESYQSELVIFAPALPSVGRTTLNGVHCLNGIPICQTEFAKDPKKPVRKDNLKAILEKVYSEEIYHVELNEIDNVDFSKYRVFSFDAVTDKHLNNIVKKALATNKKILWVGSSGIADSLFDIECKAFPALGLISSVSETTRHQVKFAENNGVKLIKVPMHELLDDRSALQKYVDVAVKTLKADKDILLISSASYDIKELYKTVEKGIELGLEKEEKGIELGLEKEETSAVVQGIIGEIGEKILSEAKVSGVFLTGGDTAIGLFNKIKASGSIILGEVAVGIPFMKVVGGKFDGLKIITKAGGFGKEDVIIYSLRKLKEKA